MELGQDPGIHIVLQYGIDQPFQLVGPSYGSENHVGTDIMALQIADREIQIGLVLDHELQLILHGQK